MNRFVIIGPPRSSTGSLVKSLADHPDCICGKELLATDVLNGEADFNFEASLKGKYISIDSNIQPPVRRLNELVPKNNIGAVGFKATTLQLNKSKTESYIPSDIHIIRIRRSIEDVLPSLIFANGIKKFHLQGNDLTAEARQVYSEHHITITKRLIAKSNFVDDLLENHNGKIHDVHYNDLNTVEGYYDVLRFLELQLIPRPNIYSKRYSDGNIIKDSIENYDVVMDDLKSITDELNLTNLNI